MQSNELMCTTCGSVGIPKKRIPGLFVVELLLWLLFIVPGLAYMLWRLSNKKNVCPNCGAENMIPLDSPVAQKILSG